MNKVMQIDATVAPAAVEIDLGADQSDIWVSARLLLPPDTITALLASSADFLDVWDASANFGTFAGWLGGFPLDTSSLVGVAANLWLDCELHFVTNTLIDGYIGGDLVASNVPVDSTDVRHLMAGFFFGTDPGWLAYIDDVRVGTTRGGAELFSDDFESGNLSAWTTVFGDASVVDDPFPPSPPPNDLLANIIDLTDAAGTVAGTTKYATEDVPYDPLVDQGGTSDSVWYRVRLPDRFANDTWLFHLSFEVVGPGGDLAVMGFVMNPGFSYPPASAGDFSVEFGDTSPSSTDYTLFDEAEDGYLYFGIGSFGDQADFTFSYAFVQPPQVRYQDPPLWRILLGNSNGRILSLLEQRSTDRSFTMNRNLPWEHTALVASDDPEINIPFPDVDSPAFLTNNMRKIWALRRERGASPPYVCRWSGIPMILEDVAADTPTTRYTAYDSWQLLLSRPIRVPDTSFAVPGEDGITYTDARASDIALDLLAATVLEDGDVFIDASDPGWIEATDVIPGDINFARETSVGEAWQKLCDTGTIDIVLVPIFDPLNRPGILSELHIFKQAGVVRHNAVFGWGMGPRNIVQLSRLIDGTQLANNVQFFMGDGSPATLQVDLDSEADFGTYWIQQTISDAEPGEENLVSQLAYEELVRRTRGVRTVEFQPAMERAPIPLLDYGPADWVPVWADDQLREWLRGYLVVP